MKNQETSHIHNNHIVSDGQTRLIIELTPSPNTVVIATEGFHQRQHAWGTVCYSINDRVSISQCHNHPLPRNLHAFGREFGKTLLKD